MKILIAHSSAELYGSDRSLLTLVDGLQHEGHECLVLLSGEGPLTAALLATGAAVTDDVNLVKVRNTLASVRSVSPGAFRRCFAAIDALVAAFGSIDIVHSNTSAVLGAAAWASRRGVPHVWTIREILAGRKLVARGLATVITRLSSQVTYNSNATRTFWESVGPRVLRRRGVTIHNVIAGTSPPPVRTASLALTIAIIGRVNGWKGHELLFDALDRLDPSLLTGLRVLVAGDAPPGQEARLEHLRQHVSRSCMAGGTEFLGFVTDMESVYTQADIVVAPNTGPEPFGRVPIEAAAHGIAVIASDLGGFRETITHDETGLLVTPGDADALARAVTVLAQDAGLRTRLGTNARDRASREQRPELMVRAYLEAYGRALGRDGRA